MCKLADLMIWITGLMIPLVLVLFMTVFMLLAWFVQGGFWLGTYFLGLRLRFMERYHG